ncbi:hypothetical protein DENSPDRAFT_894538 [Dentipellis sp. KUC8613]|nr:hypothetical protein DENSPDRAFT_894538 [Dentipellis sp. KUC8613]
MTDFDFCNPESSVIFACGVWAGGRAARSHFPIITTETGLYGVNLSVCIVTTIVLLRKDKGEASVHKMSLLMLVLMFGVATAIWRCYVVHGRSVLVAILPVLASVASFVQVRTLPIHVVCESFNRHYVLVAISLKIHSSGRLTKSSNLFAVIFFIVETGFIYTASVVAYLGKAIALLPLVGTIAMGPVVIVHEILMGVIVHLSFLALCLLLLQIKFHRCGSDAVRYTDPEPARSWDALRRIFRSGREASAHDDPSIFPAASVAIHEPTHIGSMTGEGPSPDAPNDTPYGDNPESDAVRTRAQEVPSILDVASVNP